MQVYSLSFLIPILAVFVLGYTMIVFEHSLKIHKTATALLIAAFCWAIYFMLGPGGLSADLKELGEHVSQVAQIIFFLMGAMTLVEVIDSHKGFKIVTDLIQTSSRRKMLWLISVSAFFLSSVLDNLTTTILMVSLLKKIIPHREERLLYSMMVIVAANAGGAWTPIGDVTTTMLWIDGRLSSLAVIRALFVPSIISLLIPLVFFHFRLKGTFADADLDGVDHTPEPGARTVFFLGVGALIFVPIFKGVTGLPPFMAMILGLGLLWLVTDLMHRQETFREHLRIPHILTKIDTSAVLFFLGILLAVDSLQTAGILDKVAVYLDQKLHSHAMIATFIGLFSSIMDNVPLVAATMGMYSTEFYPINDPLWHMIAYAAGTGGSILIIGSSAGIALMGMEKIDFFTYMKKMSLPTLLGFLAGMGIYLLIHGVPLFNN